MQSNTPEQTGLKHPLERYIYQHYRLKRQKTMTPEQKQKPQREDFEFSNEYDDAMNKWNQEQKPTMDDLMTDTINKVLDQQRIVKYRPYFQKAMTAAMKEWEQISMKERDEEIKRLRAMIFKAHYLAVCDLPKEEQEKYWDDFVSENNL